MTLDRARNRSLAVVATVALAAGLAGVAGGPAAAADGTVVLRGDTYTMTIAADGFRYGFTDAAGRPTLPPHPESGLRVDGADAVTAEPAGDPGAFDVTLENGEAVRVHVHTAATTVRITVDGVDDATVDLRTGPAGPSYGLGDYGAHADGQPDQGTPCSGNVEARPTLELTGIVLDNLTNQGSCKRYISTFTVFPAQGVGQVLFDEGQKRVALTDTENRLGVAGVDRVDAVHYFLAGDLKRVYADYRDARVEHGYVDVEPRPDLFELGWEAYGALSWNTYQSSVEETVQGFLDHGYPLGWGVVGSGFWPGPRGRPAEGTTNSFGMWDDTEEPGREDSQPGLPNPRYPDPDGLKRLFAENDLDLLLGARNNVKATVADGGNHNPVHDGPFMEEAAAAGLLLEDADGTPTVVSRAQFPSGASYVLDGSDPAAVEWYVDRMRAWGVDGWKEDTMLYEPDLHLDGNWNPVQQALAGAGDLLMVRNAAYSVPGDIIRINDTIYGTGEVFHEDPDRMPVNLLNMAASGAGNLYPDYVGGTPGPSLTDPAYMDYFVRNAQFNALTPVLAFGKGPWDLGRPDYAAQVLDLALWHDALHPYVYDTVLDGYETGYPSAMTPLPVAYPDDPATYGLVNDQTRQYEWMFGESLLAAPVFGADFETAQARDVYLPAGRWIDYSTGAVVDGPRTLEDYAVGTDRVPAFVGGKGVLVLRDRDESGEVAGFTAEVYPVARSSRYEWTDGDARSTILNANTGWDPDRLRIADRTTGHTVPFEVDDVTGAFRFAFEPGHDYVLSGGGRATHSLPVETAAPDAAPAAVAAETGADGQTTLSWDAVPGARTYVVEVSGAATCADGLAGSTTGTSLSLGGLDQAAGTYSVAAVNAAGTGPWSAPVAVTAPGGPAVVTVTDEGTPPTCDPDTPAYAETGTWGGSALAGFDGTRSRFSSTDGSTATWSARLPAGGYDVAVWFPPHTNSTTAATFTVTHAGGESSVVLDQTATGGRWVSLGTYEFGAEQLGSVTLTVGDAPGNARGDAVRFTPVGADPPHPGTGTWTASSSLLEDVRIENQTVRMVVRTSIGGDDLRLRLTNAFGLEPVTFGEVTVAEQQDGAELVDGSVRPVTFGGLTTVTVPAGGSIVSDPVSGSWAPASDVVVSAYVPGSVPTVTGHLRPSATTYLAGGRHTAETGGAAFTGELEHWFWLDRVSFDSTEAAGAIAVVGDSLTDGGGDVPDSNLRWPDHLARRILELPEAEQSGVLNAGMSGNRILFDDYGPRTLDRLDRDALDQPGVHTVLLFQGINDVSRSVTTAAPLIEAYRSIADRAHARGLRLVVGTLTPIGGASTYTPAKEAVRQEVNEFLRTDPAFDGVIDFDAALRDPADPVRLMPAYDKGDHLHPSDAGRERLAEAVDLALLTPPATADAAQGATAAVPRLRLADSVIETFHDSDDPGSQCGGRKVHIDSPVRAVMDQKDVVHLTVADPQAQGWQWTGSAADFAARPARAELDCVPVMDGENLDADATPAEIAATIRSFDQKTWIQGLHFDDARDTVFAYGHQDFFGTRMNALDDVCHQAGVDDDRPYCWYSAIAVWSAPVPAAAGDNHLTFRTGVAPPDHVAIYPNVTYPAHGETPPSGWIGYGTPSNIVRGHHETGEEYYLLAYTNSGYPADPADPQHQPRGICLFRSVDPAHRGSWRAWDGDTATPGFEQRSTDPYEGTNPPCAVLGTGGFTGPVRSVVWHETSGQYIAVFRDETAVRYSTSPDLVTWSAPRLLLTSTVDQANYPVVIDVAGAAHDDHDFDSIYDGGSAFLYYRKSPERGHTVITRRAIEVVVDPAPAGATP
ncbi:GDSL-type esterase/lipase family protein [Jiangella alkaliphila]|uniref:GDSL-like Lipase/Acylhydrolase n=1 Tax=Jiangella alkaliphila TaxID=419479 RepID=A0A1H2JLR3_9ACTN|nr:SGNH/GDSL hydrolase family protein [Jiangella alkaliphila]SDU57419.1 GDSL-like Lipase/Acylhydrolase [Jiangella alkaliphila]